jgi:hypothetical protein
MRGARSGPPVHLRALTLREWPLTQLRRCVVRHSVSDVNDMWGPGLVYTVSSGVAHDWPGHSEHQGRVVSITEGLAVSGLVDDPRVRQLDYGPASPDSIKLVHTPEYVDGLAEVIKQLVRFSKQRL